MAVLAGFTVSIPLRPPPPSPYRCINPSLRGVGGCVCQDGGGWKGCSGRKGGDGWNTADWGTGNLWFDGGRQHRGLCVSEGFKRKLNYKKKKKCRKCLCPPYSSCRTKLPSVLHDKTFPVLLLKEGKKESVWMLDTGHRGEPKLIIARPVVSVP